MFELRYRSLTEGRHNRRDSLPWLRAGCVLTLSVSVFLLADWIGRTWMPDVRPPDWQMSTARMPLLVRDDLAPPRTMQQLGQTQPATEGPKVVRQAPKRNP
jgi:hypothetical protein